MSGRRAVRNLRSIVWMALSAVGFLASVEFQSAAFALIASLALFAAILSVGRFPRLRE
jgi:hypothetical protein